MVVSRKAILSLLIAVVLFAGFTILAYTNLFDLVEARFYNPSVVKAINRELAGDTQTIEQFLEELQTRFAATLEEDAVRRSFAANQNSDDIWRRSDIYGALMESLAGLQSVRFIDPQGIRIHYSTWQPDILRRGRDSISYQNYTESPGYIPYWQVEAPDRAKAHIVIDDIGERLIFSHPFYDSYGVYRGTALFSLSVRAVMDRMAEAGRIKVGEDVSIISEPAGLVIGLPHAGKSAALPLVAQIWHENILSLGRLHSGLTDTGLALMSMKTTQGLYIGRLVPESILGFPRAMRIILLASFLLTAYLILFLILNIRQDKLTIIRNRIKGLQINLIKEYYDAKGDVDWDRWRKELQQRRKELHTELKRGIKPGKDTELDTLIDKSWDELLVAIGGAAGAGRKADIVEEELEELEELESSEIRELDPSELEESEGGGGKVNPASTIEFSPLSEEIEKQKEAAAKSMAEKFKIQSPFPAIFSGLSEEKPQTEEPELLLEEEDAPIELLAPEEDESVELLSVEEDESPELLSAEEDAPIELLALEEDDSEAEPQAPMESEAKPLNMYFVKPLLSVPFSAALNTEINVLEVHDVDDDATPEPVIAKRNGVPYINEGTRNPDKETIKGLDRNFKRLVESVLVND
ncbi:hypothetical protein AGMMS49942_12110 [Spirochaetia bacterium]|nr:hypothetical protein AGMMS49942_12110 [Spirochaetia bacterium]